MPQSATVLTLCFSTCSRHVLYDLISCCSCLPTGPTGTINTAAIEPVCRIYLAGRLYPRVTLVSPVSAPPCKGQCEKLSPTKGRALHVQLLASSRVDSTVNTASS